jgi:uncharacterized membrane protein
MVTVRSSLVAVSLLSLLGLVASGCDCGGNVLPAADTGTRDAGGDGGTTLDANTLDANTLDASTLDANVDASRAFAPAFVPLGDLAGGAFSSDAIAISRDGTTVVGQSVSGCGTEAMRWTEASGMIGLGDLPGGALGSRAFDVSGDGSVVIGTSQSSLVDCPGRVDEAFRWRASTGIESRTRTASRSTAAPSSVSR